MARASFEYDEVGNTFYYVLVSFYALILVPVTYFLFPTGKEEETKVDERECQCYGCVDKLKVKEANKPWRRTKKFLRIGFLVLAWLIFALIVKKVSEIEVVSEEYDPYTILGLDQGAPTAKVKKAYHELSKKMHPDRGGDSVMFDKIAKAYQALTDNESKENWEKYGNPDGPTATTFGIALPKWLVSKEYGVWVLAFYGLIFMIILPVVVGIWWYNSIKFNADKVLMDTTQLFYYFLHKTPKMEINRMIMVLSGSFEFWRQYNKEIVERETDDVELPRLMRQLPALGENKKERPLCLAYALKARILIHCHLSRIPLDSAFLQVDQRYVLARVIRLIEEMISMSQQITFYTQTKITLETMENLMKLQPMFVQGLWPKNSPLLQLPHLTEFNLNHLRKQKVYLCSDLAAMESEKRRAALKVLSDAQYRDVLVVLTSMPRLSIDTTVVVEGEDDSHEITAGCYVTLQVKLTRSSLLDPRAANLEDQRMKNEFEDDSDKSDSENEDKVNDFEEIPEPEEKKNKRKPWEKVRHQKKKGTSKKKKQQAKKAASASAAGTSDPAKPENDDEERENIDEEESVTCSDEESSRGDGSDVEEADWEPANKKNVFETKSHKTHTVHCPYYPGEKYEWWWVTLSMVDKKYGRRLASQIVSCKTLIDEQTVELKFLAPDHKGFYNYQLAVRSDSYMDGDYCKDLKMEVKEAKEIVLPKYEDTEDEEEVQADSSDEEYTEGDDSEED
ncbi:unnamed protein product [Auanema sp. JU1783]|nr:unnamed protein product [Auanema sp. JU1783]